MKRQPATTTALQAVASTLSLDAKRRPSRSGIDSWYPYYAGFSGSFARDVLKSVPLDEGATVLDPWNGSGTTTHVADQLGFRALGFDVNPVAALVASAKLARSRDAEHVLGLATRIAESAESKRATRNNQDPLSEWLKPSVASQYRVIEAAVLADLATGRTRLPLEPRSGALPPLASFLVLALMRAARSLAGVRTTTNPTWVAPGDDARGSRLMLGRLWLSTVEAMAEDLALGPATSKTASEMHVADARSLPIPDESVDLALTSPPYCTRIDYVVSTSFELAALGIGRGSPEYDRLRRACMGTPLAREGLPPELRDAWPQPVTALLNAIRNHPSKASRSYYYKTYWQYFSDCERALGELHRTLKPGGAAVLVVQSSYYKNLSVDLPQLYVALGESLGFQGHVVNKVEVRRALAQINSRSLRHRTATNYFESVVTLEKAARELEMRLFRNQVAALSTEEQRRIARKALVVMLYAHFEGVTKGLLSMYVNRLNALSLRVSDVAPSLGAASLSDLFHALRDANRKCKDFAKALPDDTALHRFARDREFVEVAWQIASRTVQINTDDVVDTESNLKPVVLKKILYRLGLDPLLAQPWESVIHQLLNRRNDVAHGTAKSGLEEKEYTSLEQAVTLVVDDLVKAISEAVSKRHYLGPTAGATGATATPLAPAEAGAGSS